MHLSEGARASAGDLIVCRKNDPKLVTEPGHTLANGDVFRIEGVQTDGIQVRRVLDADPETGRPRFASHAVFYGASKFQHTELAYAVTATTAWAARSPVALRSSPAAKAGEWLYVALTRGRNRNTAITVTRDGVRDNAGQQVAIQPREAEPQPGTRPDPQLARHDRIQRERAGLPPEPAGQAGQEREPIAVPADCMDREEREESASEYRRRELARIQGACYLGDLRRQPVGDDDDRPGAGLDRAAGSRMPAAGDPGLIGVGRGRPARSAAAR